MPYVVLSGRLAFQKVDPDNPRVPVGPEEVVEKGGYVPDYATTTLVNALSAAGNIVWTEVERPDLLPLGSEAPQVRTPDQPVVLPSDPNGQPPFVGDVMPVAEPEPTRQVPDLPSGSDNKETWENYAQLPHIGMAQAEAESMNKTALMAEVKDRYARATA